MTSKGGQSSYLFVFPQNHFDTVYRNGQHYLLLLDGLCFKLVLKNTDRCTGLAIYIGVLFAYVSVFSVLQVFAVCFLYS